jgi:hypothetical protein
MTDPRCRPGQGGQRADALPDLLHMFMQLLYSPMRASPLEAQYYSNIPFLLGEDQAVQYSLKPRSLAKDL